MANSETTQQVSAEAFFSEAEAEALITKAKAITQKVSADAEALIAEAKAIFANFRLNRDERELNERLLALGIALYPAHESEAEKMFSALGFIIGAFSDEREFEKNLSTLFSAIYTN